MAKTTPELDVLFGTSGIKRGNRRTKPNTFTEADPSSLTKEQVDNRDCTGWPTGQHIVLTGKCSGSTLQKILGNWVGLTAKDAEQPSTQLLYIPQADGSVSNVIYNRYNAAGEDWGTGTLQELLAQNVSPSNGVVAEQVEVYLSAIRTKPFILLAGISGTGKSRLVRQLARGCCPVGHDLGKDAEGHVDAAQKPGNYEIIPVRPNWHDSTELMGYVTRITAENKPEFVIRPFVRFLAKAMVYKDVPFFLCLDEMNLAPVEQYFAEYLSAVETRKKTANGIVSDVLVNFDLPEIDVKTTVKALMKDWIDVADDDTVTEKVPNAKAVYDAIVADKGLRIPPNLVVMGTVNMDETTCSFSRKVFDRAMTFELNEVDMDEGLASDNSIPYGSILANQAFATDVEGCDFYTANKDLCDTVKTYLLSVNAVLEDTPFKFAYRSRNEIMLYCIERTKDGVVSPARALDEATSMKILSRIEGDDQKLLYVGDNPAYNDKTILDALKGEIAAALKVVNGGTDPVDCTVCAKKLDFMARRLGGGFTNFFV